MTGRMGDRIQDSGTARSWLSSHGSGRAQWSQSGRPGSLAVPEPRADRAEPRLLPAPQEHFPDIAFQEKRIRDRQPFEHADDVPVLEGVFDAAHTGVLAVPEIAVVHDLVLREGRLLGLGGGAEESHDGPAGANHANHL